MNHTLQLLNEQSRILILRRSPMSVDLAVDSLKKVALVHEMKIFTLLME